VLTADGGSVPYNLASAQLLSTNPTVRTPQGDYAYSELSTLYGYAAPSTSDGVPFIPGFPAFLQGPAGGATPSWVLPVAFVGAGLIVLTAMLGGGGSR
jgi:hypothetical protein